MSEVKAPPELRGRIQKFIIIPVCTVYNREDKVVQEERMKPITHYSANDLDLKVVAAELERVSNDKYWSKIKASDIGRYHRD